MTNYLRRIARNWQIYVFLLLPTTYLIIFAYIPMAGIQLAFKTYHPMKGIWGSPWVGFVQFEKFFSSYYFQRLITNTLRISLYSLVASFPIPILFSLLLNAMPSQRMQKLVQTITYMPHFISTVVLVGMLMQLFSPIVGLYANISRLLGILHPEDLFSKPNVFPHLYVWSGVWQNYGWSSIIYIAALSAVSPELHEAAQIDGATRFQRVIHVDFPALLPTATIMLILRFGQIMNVGFEKAFLMQNTLNMRTSEVISTYVYKIGLGSGGRSDYAYSTAIGLFNSAINLCLIFLVNRATRKLSSTSLW